jgi:uncharacterized membrane protein YeaQ/YmgE (transglycosylase-associated protein family)
MELIISLLSGAVGGNLAGAVLKKSSMGTLWNSVLGILGGGIGGQRTPICGFWMARGTCPGRYGGARRRGRE